MNNPSMCGRYTIDAVYDQCYTSTTTSNYPADPTCYVDYGIVSSTIPAPGGCTTVGCHTLATVDGGNFSDNGSGISFTVEVCTP